MPSFLTEQLKTKAGRWRQKDMGRYCHCIYVLRLIKPLNPTSYDDQLKHPSTVYCNVPAFKCECRQCQKHQLANLLNSLFSFFLSGDERHKSLSGLLTDPSKPLWGLPHHLVQVPTSTIPHIPQASSLSVAQLSSLDFNLGTWISEIANANKELPAAVPVDSCWRRLGLFYTSTFTATGMEQDGEGACQELGGPDEECGNWFSARQKGLGVEPVLRTGGVHGVRATVRGEGKTPVF